MPQKEIEKVDWAEPENEIDEEVMQKVKVLFVRNLMSITTEEQIRSVFESLIDGCDGGAVERVKKSKDYAFVHFRDGVNCLERQFSRIQHMKMRFALYHNYRVTHVVSENLLLT